MREGNSLRVQSVTLGRFLTKPYYESLQPVRGELQRQQQRNSKQHKGIIHQETVPHFRVNQGLRKRQQFTCTKNIRAKTRRASWSWKQLIPSLLLEYHLLTHWVTGLPQERQHLWTWDKGHLTAPGVSRRTEWRSIIHTTSGLLRSAGKRPKQESV